MKKTILQLCADTGSDTWPYRNDDQYEVIAIGADIGVENYSPDRPIHGIIANPVCTEFSMVRRGKPGENFPHVNDHEKGLVLVRECQRIIEEASPVWWAIENPATGALRNYLGKPDYVYQPWWYGSPWTKKTALWGQFNTPQRTVSQWSELEEIPELWIRPGRDKASIVYQHKSAFKHIPEFVDAGLPAPTSDSEFRSLCSQGFAHAFKLANP